MMNFRGCLSSNPPVVIFICDVFLVAFAALVLANLVIRTNKIRDPDTLDWNTFFFKISSLHICMEKPEQPLPPLEHPFSREREIVTISVPMYTKLINKMEQYLNNTNMDGSYDGLRINGTVKMKDLNRGRLDEFDNFFVLFTLDFPKMQFMPLASYRNICMTINGPQHLMDELNLGYGPAKCKMPHGDHRLLRNFSTHSEKGLPAKWCPSGENLAFHFENHDEWTIYVDEEHKQRSFVHLTHASIILFTIASLLAIVKLFVSGKEDDADIEQWSTAQYKRVPNQDLEMLPSLEFSSSSDEF